MSWLLSEIAKWRRTKNKPYENVDVEMSELRNAIGLKWFLGYGDEQLSPEELGAIIDGCLVEYISDLLKQIEESGAGIEEFESTMSLVEEGTSEDQDLRAYAVKLPKDSEVEGHKPASETYIEMAKRHTMNGEKLPADLEEKETCQLARALLEIAINEDWAGYDWKLEEYSQFRADEWRREQDPYEIQLLIRSSQWNAADFDTLQIICEDTARNEIDKLSLLPHVLLQWFVAANLKYLKRPSVPPTPRGPHRTHGIQIRNNEIRHAVYLLGQVDVSMPDAHFAVGKAMNLDPDTIRNICGQFGWTLEDLRLDGEGRAQTRN